MANSISVPFRWLTPSQLAICLVLFFLPWVEIQCATPKELDFKNVNAKPDLKNVDWTPLIRQSGLQAAIGSYTFVDQKVEKLREMQDSQEKKPDKKGDKPDAAILLWPFPIAIVAGILIGLIAPSSVKKKAPLFLCCILALGTVVVQAVVGFPITQNAKNEMKQDGDKKNPPQLQIGEAELIRTSYKFPFYATLLLCLGATVTTLIESPPKRRKKRIEYDFEEDPPEDEEPLSLD